MSLLETITKALTNPEPSPTASKRPIPLHSDSILLSLKSDSGGTNLNPISLVNPLTGFKISASDSDVVSWNNNFSKKLKQMLKKHADSSPVLSAPVFFDSLTVFLKLIARKVNISVNIEDGYDRIDCVAKLIERLREFIGEEVIGLLIECLLVLKQWRLLETLLVNKLVGQKYRSNLLYNLTMKRRSDMLCLCAKHFTDLTSGDLCWLLKYFLLPSKEAYMSMTSVRKEWESQALLAIEKATTIRGEYSHNLGTNEAAILLMMAYDGFLSNELCLHFILSSSSIDEIVFSNAISKLDMDEMLALIKYLGKWLRKYERFPQAVAPSPRSANVLGLKVCAYVPKLEQVVEALGVVFDVHFTSLVLHSEFHEELKAIEGIVGCLITEGRLCCSMANLIKVIRRQVKDE